MKHNLKNRPTFEKKSPLYQHFARDIDEWFEEFEKELRQKLESLCYHNEDAKKVLEEILGE